MLYVLKKLQSYTLTFILIINLTPDFMKYSTIFSYLKKLMPIYPHLLTVEVKRPKYPLLSEKFTLSILCEV